jgi:hypothetical protein
MVSGATMAESRWQDDFTRMIWGKIVTQRAAMLPNGDPQAPKEIHHAVARDVSGKLIALEHDPGTSARSMRSVGGQDENVVVNTADNRLMKLEPGVTQGRPWGPFGSCVTAT